MGTTINAQCRCAIYNFNTSECISSVDSREKGSSKCEWSNAGGLKYSRGDEKVDETTIELPKLGNVHKQVTKNS